MEMNNRLKILHLEDNPFDAELIHNCIQNEWSNCEIKLVTKKDSFMNAIDNETFNLVLCDFRIPTFDSGFEVLEILKKKHWETPILFITGTIGEETAVNLMKEGATDYILKDKLVKLIPAIKRALNEKTELEDKKNTQKALRESEERYRNLFLNSPVGIYSCSLQGEIIDANPSFVNILGFTSLEELKKEKSKNKNFPIKENDTNFEEMMEKYGEVIGFETIWQKEEKNPIYVRQNNKAIKDEEGNTLSYEGTVEDITEIKKAQSSLAKSESRLSIAQEIAHIGYWEYDLTSMELIWSKGLYKIFGLAQDEIKADLKLFMDMIHPEDKNLLKEVENKFMEIREETTFYYRIIKPDGGIRYLYSIIKTDSENNKVKKIFGTVQDVTEQKLSENNLIKAKEDAEESNRLKSSFLANMSHELRTPLTGILGFSDILSDEIITPEHNEMVKGIKVSCKRLLETLNSILDLSRIEANKYEINFSLINLNEIINDEYKLFYPSASAKNIFLNLNLPQTEIFIKSDEKILKIIISNLVNNAIKFTSKGGVTITLESLIDSVKINIKDTGIGISDENQKFVFEEFRQASEGLGRRFEGSGLGLTLVKKFVDLLEGEINLKSELNSGSEFSVIFPVSETLLNDRNISIKKKPEEDIKQLIPKLHNTLMRDKRILLVEDDVVNVTVMKIMLKQIYSLDVARNGETALELAKQNDYDLFLMDINLGAGLDGLGVTRILKEWINIHRRLLLQPRLMRCMVIKKNLLRQAVQIIFQNHLQNRSL